VQETVGGAITKNESFQQAIKGVKTWVDTLANSPDFKLWLDNIVRLTVSAAQAMGKFAGACKDAMDWVFGATRAEKGFIESQEKLNLTMANSAAAQAHLKWLKDMETAGKKAAPPIKEVGDRIGGLNKAIAKLQETKVEKSLWDMKIAAQKAVPDFEAFGETLDTAVLPPARDMLAVFQKLQQATQSETKATQEWAGQNQTAFEMVLGAASSVTSQIDGIMQQSLTNKLAKLDKEYQARLENIKNSKMSEEEKQEAITALEAEYDMKRREVQRKAAEQGKALAIAQAIINVAEGVTAALKAAPPPFNIALAAITAALGAVQIALIKSQPIPLAKGGILDRPTFSQDGNFLAGEAGPELVMPLKELPKIFREVIKADGGGFGNNRPIVIINKIILDGKEMKTFITQVVRQSGGLGLLGETGRSFA
jgi:hypothetical protein